MKKSIVLIIVLILAALVVISVFAASNGDNYLTQHIKLPLLPNYPHFSKLRVPVPPIFPPFFKGLIDILPSKGWGRSVWTY